MESELDRLERMYMEMGEEHLRDMQEDFARDPESLTDDARLALERTLRARGLASGLAPEWGRDAVSVTPAHEHEQGFVAGIPGVFPSSAAVIEQALDPGGERRDGMIHLITFFDGSQLSRACEVLEEAGIDLAVEPIDGDAQAGAPPSFGVWVEEPDRLEAQRRLRETMELFPLSEVAGEPDTGYDDASMPLAQFETAAEQEQARALLAAAGIASTLNAETDAEGNTWHSVEVRGTDRERGLEVVASGLGAARS